MSPETEPQETRLKYPQILNFSWAHFFNLNILAEKNRHLNEFSMQQIINDHHYHGHMVIHVKFQPRKTELR